MGRMLALHGRSDITAFVKTPFGISRTVSLAGVLLFEFTGGPCQTFDENGNDYSRQSDVSMTKDLEEA